jgi:hypothetical protein
VEDAGTAEDSVRFRARRRCFAGVLLCLSVLWTSGLAVELFEGDLSLENEGVRCRHGVDVDVLVVAHYLIVMMEE